MCLERASIAEWLRTPTKSPVDFLSGKQVNEVNWSEGGASEDLKFVANSTYSNGIESCRKSAIAGAFNPAEKPIFESRSV